MKALPNPDLPLLRPYKIERRLLLEKLNLIPQHKLTLVAAPPGYGKSTVVTQFAHQTTYPVVWHAVEAKERDATHLYAHTLDLLLPLSPDFESLPETSPLEGIIALTDHLQHSVERDIIYILDDVQHLIGSPDAEQWLQTFVERIPPAFHLVLIGRALPALPLIDLVARSDVLALGQEQLRFTFQELELLGILLGTPKSAPEIQIVASRFNGWPAGSVLAFQPMPQKVEEALFSGKQGPEAMFDTLAEALLRSQTPQLQDFLLASSVLTRMTPTLCEVALGLAESREHFADVLRLNRFVSEVPGGMIYHPLFRDFLQRYLQSHDPNRSVAIHGRAARWFEANNRLEEAFDHYVCAAQIEKAAAIAERSAQAYFAQGKAETLLYWRGELKNTAIHAPRLLYTCAMIHVDRYEYTSATKALLLAEQGFEMLHHEPGAIQVILLRANIANQRGEFQQALTALEQLRAFSQVPANLRGYMLFILGTAHLNLGDPDTALEEYSEALPLYRAVGDAHALSNLLLTMEQAAMRVGRFEEADACLQEAIAIRRALGSEAGLLPPLNNLGYDYHMLGEYRLASETFEEALQIAGQVSEKRIESYLLWSLGDLRRDTGDVEQARSAYNRALHTVSKWKSIGVKLVKTIGS